MSGKAFKILENSGKNQEFHQEQNAKCRNHVKSRLWYWKDELYLQKCVLCRNFCRPYLKDGEGYVLTSVYLLTGGGREGGVPYPGRSGSSSGQVQPGVPPPGQDRGCPYTGQVPGQERVTLGYPSRSGQGVPLYRSGPRSGGGYPGVPL